MKTSLRGRGKMKPVLAIGLGESEEDKELMPRGKDERVRWQGKREEWEGLMRGRGPSSTKRRCVSVTRDIYNSEGGGICQSEIV